jgi:hypothetical protein
VVRVTKVVVVNKVVKVVKEVVAKKVKVEVKRLSTTGWGAGGLTG